MAKIRDQFAWFPFNKQVRLPKKIRSTVIKSMMVSLDTHLYWLSTWFIIGYSRLILVWGGWCKLSWQKHWDTQLFYENQPHKDPHVIANTFCKNTSHVWLRNLIRLFCPYWSTWIAFIVFLPAACQWCFYLQYWWCQVGSNRRIRWLRSTKRQISFFCR